jgi:hypothetical protein
MSATVTPRVEVETRPLWRLRLSLSATRWLLYALAVAGIAASARFALVPPRVRVPPAPHIERVDPAAEGFATLFARRYLTWSADRPALHAEGLAPFLGSDVDPDGGLRAPSRGTQRVGWTEVVQTNSVAEHEHLYTVAAETDASGLVYLSIDVVRDADGRLRLGRYPAIVGAPLVRPARSLAPAGAGELGDAGLGEVVVRALRNYLAGSRQNLDADLVPGALVEPPDMHLALARVEQLRAAPRGGVLATVSASDSRGATFALVYQLAVLRQGGRWEVAAIQPDPSL